MAQIDYYKMTFVEPLDLERILINNLAGSAEIFIFMAFITIGAVTASLRIPKSITLVLLGLFSVILANQGFAQPIYLLSVVIVGMIASNVISRIIVR